MLLRVRTPGSVEELAYAGALNYLTVNLNTKEDRGPWQYIGKTTVSTGVWDTLNVTLQTRFIFNSPYAVANNGIMLKTGYSDSTVASKTTLFSSSEEVAAQRPRWLIWYHRRNQPVHIGQ